METFAVPVIHKRDKNDPGVRVILPLEHLLYLRVIGKQIFFYAFHRREYFLNASFSDWRILLDGLGFEEVDRGTLVNTRNIAFIYEDLQQIHFAEEAQGVFCHIAKAHITRLNQQYPNIPILINGAMKLEFT